MDILYHPICFGVLHDTLICSSLLACVHAVVGSMRPSCGWKHVSMLWMDTCVHAVHGHMRPCCGWKHCVHAVDGSNASIHSIWTHVSIIASIHSMDACAHAVHGYKRPAKARLEIWSV